MNERAGENAFEVLGLEARFDVDRAAVHRAYLARAASLHPDRGVEEWGEGADDRGIARLNRARAALDDAEKRAHELLGVLSARYGVWLSDADRRALPPGFLTEMLEAREQMESDLSSGDKAMRQRWESWAREKRAGHEASVGAKFREIAAEGKRVTAESLRAIQLELNAWRYVERMIEQIGEGPAV